MSWVLFAVLAQAVWASAIILDKIIRTKFIKDSVFLVALFGVFDFVPFLFVIPFVNLSVPNSSALIAALVAGALMTVALAPYVKSLAFEEASRVTLLWLTGPIFVLLMAHLFLGERLTINSYIAFVLLLVGGVLISIKKIEGIFKLSTAFWLMLFSAFLFAVSDILIKFVYSTQSYWNGAIWVGLGTPIGSAALVMFFRRRFFLNIKKISNASLALVMSSAISGFMGRLLYFLAIMLGSVSIVAVIGGFEGLFVLLYALLLSIWLPKILKEEISKKILLTKVVAIFFMISGLSLLYL
jgi:drug/metabolite transporter (DMT)-like permease